MIGTVGSVNVKFVWAAYGALSGAIGGALWVVLSALLLGSFRPLFPSRLDLAVEAVALVVWYVPSLGALLFVAAKLQRRNPKARRFFVAFVIAWYLVLIAATILMLQPPERIVYD